MIAFTRLQGSVPVVFVVFIVKNLVLWSKLWN